MTSKNTNNFYDNPNSHFGGIIRLSDFCTNHPCNRDIARRIASDHNFDEQCRRNEEARDRRRKERD